MSETKLVKEILLALGNEPDFICWRNNTGALKDGYGRLVKYGLAVGSADIIGVLRGKFVALEPKGSHSDKCKCKSCSAQRVWGAAVLKAGGAYSKVRTVQEAKNIVHFVRAGRFPSGCTECNYELRTGADGNFGSHECDEGALPF